MVDGIVIECPVTDPNAVYNAEEMRSSLGNAQRGEMYVRTSKSLRIHQLELTLLCLLFRCNMAILYH